MPADATAAARGRARTCAGPVARCAWRLLALLGLAYAAVVLCSTSANAAGCDGPTCHDSSSATKPGLLSVLLRTTDALLEPAGSRASAQHVPVAAAPAPGGEVSQDASASILDAGHRSPAPHLLSTGSATSLDGLLSTSADAVALPHVHGVVTPLVEDAADATAAGVGIVADVTAPLPVVGSLVPRLGTVTAAVTTTLTSGIASLTTRVDAGVTSLAATITGVLAPLSGARRAAGAGSSTPTGAGATPTQSAADLAAPLVLAVRDAVREPAYTTLLDLGDAARGVPPAPPQHLSVAVVQSAPAAVAALAAPASGAVGIASGTGPAPAGASSPHEQAESPRSFPFRAVMAIGRRGVAHAGPMPSTPLVDPGFSPD